MRFAASIRRNERGVTIIEFALLLPVLMTFIVGITQLGALFYVNSDLRAAVAEGARLASLYPVPDDATITSGVSSKFVHLSGANLTAPSVVHGTDTSGHPYVDVTASYRVPLNFMFFTVSPVTLSETRRVFTQVESPYTQNSTSASTSSGTTTASGTTTSASTTSASTSSGTTTATSSGTTTATSSGTTTATSSGTTTATSSGTTTATSSGTTTATSSGTTTATSSGTTTATSSGTTTSTTSTTTGNNASSGNAHTHGNCPTC